jgi:hypothetical protein
VPLPSRRAGCFLAILLFLTAPAAGQRAPESLPGDSLYQTIAALDSAMFEAYNRCELEQLATFFTDDLEFYHDQTGLMRSRTALVEAVRQNICGKVHRDLDSLRVFPLRGYGAVTTGVHRFCDAKRYTHCGQAGGPARFVTLWQRTEAGWLITRVVSYDHQ